GATRELFIKPGAHQNGVAIVSVTATSEGLESEPVSFDLDVTPINDPPLLEAFDPVSVAEGGTTPWLPVDASEVLGDGEDPVADLQIEWVGTPTCATRLQNGAWEIQCLVAYGYVGAQDVAVVACDTQGECSIEQA